MAIQVMPRAQRNGGSDKLVRALMYFWDGALQMLSKFIDRFSGHVLGQLQNHVAVIGGKGSLRHALHLQVKNHPNGVFQIRSQRTVHLDAFDFGVAEQLLQLIAQSVEILTTVGVDLHQEKA